MFRSYEFLEFDNTLEFLVFLNYSKLVYLSYTLYFNRFIYDENTHKEEGPIGLVGFVDQMNYVMLRKDIPYV